ncbi:MAG: glycosyltransferase [Synechococcales bacterium]|nr:glycosyltransferase [Synechococcales bacterium]
MIRINHHNDDSRKQPHGQLQSCTIILPSSSHFYDYWAKCIAAIFTNSQVIFLNELNGDNTEIITSILEQNYNDWVFIEPTLRIKIEKIYSNKLNHNYGLCLLLFDNHYLYRRLYLPWASISDLVICENPFYTGMYRRYAINSHFLPYPFERLKLDSSHFSSEITPELLVSFVGNITQLKPYRKFYLDFLNKNGLKVEIYGYGSNNGYISYQEMVDIFSKSYISLNFTQGTFEASSKEDLVYERILNGRIFEIVAAGGLCLCEYSTACSLVWEDFREIVYFFDEHDLLEKIRYLTQNPNIARDIRKNAYQKYCAEFSGEVFSQNLKDRLLKCKNIGLNLNLEIQKIIYTDEFILESKKSLPSITFRSIIVKLLRILGIHEKLIADFRKMWYK